MAPYLPFPVWVLHFADILQLLFMDMFSCLWPLHIWIYLL